MADWTVVARVINDQLAERGMTQAELAERSGVSMATLREIQGGGERPCTQATLASISRTLAPRGGR